MKILHLVESGGLYGMERVLLDLAEAQLHQGDEPIIVNLAPPGAGPRAVERAVQDRGIMLKAWRMRAGLNVLGMRAIMKWGNQLGVDVFHAHGYRLDALLACADPFRKRVRVSTQHGLTLRRDGSLRLSQRLGLACLPALDQVVFVSEGLREAYGSHLKNTVVIPNGIKLQPIQTVRASEVRTNGNQLELLAIGRLSHEKNYALLLDVVHELVRRDVPCRLTHFGDGKLKAELEQKVKQLGLTNVRFAGYSDAVFEHLHAADVLLFTSRSEGMPVTVLEAMVLGVPVVSTAVGGIPEMLEFYPLGRTTTNHTPIALANLIMDVCEPGERRRATAETIAEAESRYSAGRMARAYRAVYEPLLA